MAALLTVTLVIIFQPELRHALARLGSANWFSFNRSQKQAFFEVFSDTVICLSQKRTGALIAFERGISLGEHAETGVRLDAIFSKELVQTIFNPKTALHDGGMIISNETIHSAGCVFPVTQRHLSDRSLGLRHRAAIGVSEETDAVAIVVSEETGNISICADGKMERAISPQDFLDRLLLLFLPNDQETEEPRDEQPDREDRIPPASDRDLVSD